MRKRPYLRDARLQGNGVVGANSHLTFSQLKPSLQDDGQPEVVIVSSGLDADEHVVEPRRRGLRPAPPRSVFLVGRRGGRLPRGGRAPGGQRGRRRQGAGCPRLVQQQGEIQQGDAGDSALRRAPPAPRARHGAGRHMPRAPRLHVHCTRARRTPPLPLVPLPPARLPPFRVLWYADVWLVAVAGRRVFVCVCL